MIDKKAFAVVYFCKQKAGGIDVRLFVAVDLSGEVKDALEDIQGQIKGSGVRGRYTARENLHITLAFIGEYGDAQAVLDALEGVRFEPFELGLDGMSSFGGLWKEISLMLGTLWMCWSGKRTLWQTRTRQTPL
ncbi:MAG: hypothetical protein IJR47_01585 [Clostridia bacterium]|nr:hypothetical protein [Clostridia bacterium]